MSVLVPDENCPVGRERGNHSGLEPECTCRLGKSPAQLRAIIAFARLTWPNDGAEGETVHVLCDELEARLVRG